jgi:hypothetical protein
MNYNKRRICQRAWELIRTGNNKSVAFKQAWLEAKHQLTIESAYEIVDNESFETVPVNFIDAMCKVAEIHADRAKELGKQINESQKEMDEMCVEAGYDSLEDYVNSL